MKLGVPRDWEASLGQTEIKHATSDALVNIFDISEGSSQMKFGILRY